MEIKNPLVFKEQLKKRPGCLDFVLNLFREPLAAYFTALIETVKPSGLRQESHLVQAARITYDVH
jgi:hypothetical protein